MRDTKLTIFNAIQRGTSSKTSALAKRFSLTRQAVHRHLKALVREGKILRMGGSLKNSYYALNSPEVLKRIWKGQDRYFKKSYDVAGLEEDRVFQEIKSQPSFLTSLDEAAWRILQYSFTEMLNNAIDHSASRRVLVSLAVNPEKVAFEIRDLGVGVFENICAQKHLGSEMEAIQDVLKGKQTTMPSRHSGEGIFFTSKAVDRFILESHKKRLLVDNLLEDVFVEDVRFRKGTRVACEIDIKTSRRLDEIFNRYTNEDFQFQKSQVKIVLFQEGEAYVSRSQAKRLLHALEEFREIVLDFSGVTTIGQGFADEIFRVFQSQHPEIIIQPVHCHENVQFMINRAKSFSQTD